MSKQLLKHIKDTVEAHLGYAHSGVVDVFWEAHESCKRGEWEDTGDLKFTLVNLCNVPDTKVEGLIKAFTNSTLVNDEDALEG